MSSQRGDWVTYCHRYNAPPPSYHIPGIWTQQVPEWSTGTQLTWVKSLPDISFDVSVGVVISKMQYQQTASKSVLSSGFQILHSFWSQLYFDHYQQSNYSLNPNIQFAFRFFEVSFEMLNANPMLFSPVLASISALLYSTPWSNNIVSMSCWRCWPMKWGIIRKSIFCLDWSWEFCRRG